MFLSNIERNPWHKNGLSETTRILGKLNLNFFFTLLLYLNDFIQTVKVSHKLSKLLTMLSKTL